MAKKRGRPVFPDRFESFDHARTFATQFLGWHNGEHRHSGIGFHTPASVYFGTAPEIRAQRAVVLNQARARHPERFVRGPPTPPPLPDTVYINPPTQEAIGTHQFIEETASPGLTGAIPRRRTSRGPCH